VSFVAAGTTENIAVDHEWLMTYSQPTLNDLFSSFLKGNVAILTTNRTFESRLQQSLHALDELTRVADALPMGVFHQHFVFLTSQIAFLRREILTREDCDDMFASELSWKRRLSISSDRLSLLASDLQRDTLVFLIQWCTRVVASERPTMQLVCLFMQAALENDRLAFVRWLLTDPQVSSFALLDGPLLHSVRAEMRELVANGHASDDLDALTILTGVATNADQVRTRSLQKNNVKMGPR
jgi:hypothetical protein